jgi:hypothetical protein
MPGFTSYDQIINALTVSLYGQRLPWLKPTAFTTAASAFYTLWNTAGFPGQGTYAGTAANSQACTSATDGAIEFANATSPRKLWLLGGEGAGNYAGTLFLWDRLLYYPGIDHNTTGAQALTTGATLPRATFGEKVFAWLEVTSALGATAQTCTLSYTNQSGTPSRSTGAQTIQTSSVVSRLPFARPYFPLQAGDTGIRSVESYTFSAANTGTSALVLARLIAMWGQPVASVVSSLDLVRGPGLSLPQIEDDSCLFFTFAPNSAIASPTLYGNLQLCEN